LEKELDLHDSPAVFLSCYDFTFFNYPFLKKLRNYRTSGLNNGGEYSYENLVYKVLRRNGYLEKLQKLENNIIDKKLSLKENELYKQNNIFIKKK
jgi:hypothetical protein